MNKIDKKALEILRARFGDLTAITGDGLRQFVAETARSFLGATEGSTGHMMLIDIYNEQEPLPRGYTMTLKDAWCAAACTAWAIMAGVGEIVPKECSCSKLIELAKGMGIWVEDEAEHKARVGDWCLFDWQDNGKGDNTGAPDHVGIVTARGENGFEVTDANNNNRVWERNMTDNAVKIRGFICPDYDGYAKRIRESCCVAGFLDVPQGVYYHDALEWTKEKGIVYGIDDAHFGPDLTTSRAQAVAMLHRLWCMVQPTGVELPFEDVSADAWYLEALEWAWDRGIVIGVSGNTFEPDRAVKRCEIVTMIHRLMAGPDCKGTNSPFTDCDLTAWYGPAVVWAWEQGIVEGVGEHRFDPEGDLLRRDAVCILHRWHQKV